MVKKELLSESSPDLFWYYREGEEWYRIRKTIAPKIMRPKIVEENIDNFNAVTKDTVARFVKLNKACGPNDHIPDLEGELIKWSTESKFVLLYTYTKAPLNSLHPYKSQMLSSNLTLLLPRMQFSYVLPKKKKKERSWHLMSDWR